MKKLIIFAAAIVALPLTFSCGPSKAELAKKARQDSIRVADSIKQAEEKAAAEAKAKAEADSIARDKKVADFLTDMYNSHKYENHQWLKAHCTQKVISKLQRDYDYDDGGLATWDFRSGAQDGPTNAHNITEVKPVGEGWYQYSFVDMGVNGSHKVLIIDDGDSFKIDGLK